MKHLKFALAVTFALVVPAPAAAQDAPATVAAVGDAAPDFELPAATRYGVLAEPFRLSDYRGSTVVLAFFPRARTKG